MLISRGAEYKSAAAAWKRTSDGNRYHDHCRCIAVPIFTNEAFDASRFDQNRELQALWKTQIADKRLSGVKARQAWNEFIKTKYQSAAADPAAV